MVIAAAAAAAAFAPGEGTHVGGAKCFNLALGPQQGPVAAWSFAALLLQPLPLFW